MHSCIIACLFCGMPAPQGASQGVHDVFVEGPLADTWLDYLYRLHTSVNIAARMGVVWRTNSSSSVLVLTNAQRCGQGNARLSIFWLAHIPLSLRNRTMAHCKVGVVKGWGLCKGQDKAGLGAGHYKGKDMAGLRLGHYKGKDIAGLGQCKGIATVCRCQC